MSREYHHRFTKIGRLSDGTHGNSDPDIVVAPMFDGQVLARDKARSSGCDVRHEAYNDGLRKWTYLGMYHPDGTCTGWTGERYLFVEDPVSPWLKFENDLEF